MVLVKLWICESMHLWACDACQYALTGVVTCD
uniref:Uncharacterized protein n=1 Tax=Arundo donax TaxID=35708 RepID=A0A0A8ZVY0_ARUDO